MTFLGDVTLRKRYSFLLARAMVKGYGPISKGYGFEQNDRKETLIKFRLT